MKFQADGSYFGSFIRDFTVFNFLVPFSKLWSRRYHIVSKVKIHNFNILYFESGTVDPQIEFRTFTILSQFTSVFFDKIQEYRKFSVIIEDRIS